MYLNLRDFHPFLKKKKKKIRRTKYKHSRRWFSAGIYLLKVNNRNTRTKCKICSKLTIKAPERHQWRKVGLGELRQFSPIPP